MQIDTHAFAKDWIDAFNSHDLEWILSHYEDGVTLTSPRARLLLGDDEGTVRGKSALRDYFRRSLEKLPDLKFALDRVYSGVKSVVIEFHTTDGRHVAEFMAFGESGLVTRVVANYA